MLAPQFTLRRLLGVVSASAVACCALGFAARGHLWAVAVGIALLGLAVMMSVYALVYLVMRLLATSVERRRRRKAASAG